MAHIKVKEGIPGIRSLVLFRPETGKPLYDLAQVLLRGPSPLTEAERELIAAYVSNGNDCMFCMSSHAAAARCLFGEEKSIVDDVLKDMQRSGVSDKMKAARALGADDREIHDTVLTAAAFCMFNRYVDGLESFTPTDAAAYEEMGKRMAEKGYVQPQQTI